MFHLASNTTALSLHEFLCSIQLFQYFGQLFSRTCLYNPQWPYSFSAIGLYYYHDLFLNSCPIYKYSYTYIRMEAIVIKHQVIISSGLFREAKTKKKLQDKTQILAKKVQLNHNQHPTIIKQITHINFLYTQFLQLSYNNITSLEAIRHINAPLLIELHLSFNHISNLFSLSKANFPRLKALGLMGNPIVDGKYLSYLNFPCLNKLLLEEVKQNVCYFQDMAIFAKNPFILEIMRTNTKRIAQTNVANMVKSPKYI